MNREALEQANRPDRVKKPRPGRPGVTRALAEQPDHTVVALADTCPHCQHAVSAADQPEVHACDRIDLPPIKPVVTRVERHRGVCPCCRKGFSAPVPEGLEPGSPFGPSIVALIIHLHITQAISFERLVRLMSEVFGLEISEGAIDNMLKRAEAALTTAADAIADEVRASPVIASDETSTRAEGKTWWQWVLMNTTAIYFAIVDTRAASVVTDFLAGVRPEVWVNVIKLADSPVFGDNGQGLSIRHLTATDCVARVLVLPEFGLSWPSTNKHHLKKERFAC